MSQMKERACKVEGSMPLRKTWIYLSKQPIHVRRLDDPQSQFGSLIVTRSCSAIFLEGT
jgi:hypothetical protein